MQKIKGFSGEKSLFFQTNDLMSLQFDALHTSHDAFNFFRPI